MKMMKANIFKTLGILFAVSILITFFAAVTMAAAYPVKPIRLIVPAAAGGAHDNVARLIAPRLSDRLGQQVIVDDRAGGGGIIGTEAAAKANPDGYTLLIVATSHVTQPALEPLPYDPIKSFTPVVRMGIAPYLFVVHPDVPAQSVTEFIPLAKQKPNQLIFVTSGVGGGTHLVTELFQIMAGVKLKIVHFKGGGPAVTDLIGGHSHGLFGSAPLSQAHVKSGKLRLLGTCGAKRSAILPDVPTIAEAGLSGFQSSQWFGIVAPAGMPEPIVDRLNKEIEAILTVDEVKNKFLALGMEVDYQGPKEFGSFVAAEIATWLRVVKEANIKVEK